MCGTLPHGFGRNGWVDTMGFDSGKISVVVPVYRVEPYLRRCLDSIVDQSYRNLEIILVDDGSPDGCGVICDEYASGDDRIIVIHQDNRGVAAARNAGLDIATGDWIAWVDPDDWIERDMFQYLIDGASRFQADIVICGMRKTDRHASPATQYREERILNREQALREFLLNKNMNFSCCDKLTKRSLWTGLRFSDLKIGEDFLAVGRLLNRAGVIVCLPEIKYNYVTRPESALTDGSLESRLDCWRAAVMQYDELGPVWPQLMPALAGRCAAAAVGVWGAYPGAAGETRKNLFPEIKKIALFCRSHRRDALNNTELGLAGRIALRMTPYPTWWAFSIARGISRLYRIKHKRPL